jgi:hypothetical protein
VKDLIVILATLGPEGVAPHFLKPAHFRFQSTAECSDVPDDVIYDWIPRPLAENHRIGRALLLFANQQAGAPYLYLGELVDGINYCGGKDYRRRWVNFTLAPKLSRKLWLRFGGYPAGKVTINHRDLLLDVGDGERFAACLAEVRSRVDSHLIVTRYKGDSLKLLANEREGYLTYEAKSGSYRMSRNQDYPEDTTELTLFRCTCGISLEMPLCYAIAKERAVEATGEFFRTGRLPASIKWAKG